MDIDPTAHTHTLDGRTRDGVGAIILVEGLDATGKSSLCKQLYDLLPAPTAILHAGPPLVTTAIREYVWPLGIAAAGYIVICDRWHLGETVWPHVFNRDSLIPDKQMLWHIEENMRYLRTPILPLYMVRAFRQIEMELQVRNQDAPDVLEQDLVNLEIAAKLYDDAIRTSSMPWNNTTLDQGASTVLRWLDDELS